MSEQHSDMWDDNSRRLWQRIQSHRFDEPEQGTDMVRRIAHEQSWDQSTANRVIEEYRRYCFLSCVSGSPMTPSDAVDEVWHLHLIHTRDYWQQFCAQVLQRDLHHMPTRGGSAEVDKHRLQYARTLGAYESYFGPAPHDLWPPSHVQFAPKPVLHRVDKKRHWIIRRPSWRGGRIVAVTAVASATMLIAGRASALPANPFDWDGREFLGLYLILVMISVAMAIGLRRHAREHGPARGQPSTAYEWAYLADGPARCVDAAVAQLMADGVIDWNVSSRELKVIQRRLDLATPLDIVSRSIERNGKPAAVIKKASSHLGSIKLGLEQRALWMNDSQVFRARWTSALPLLMVFGFGVTKLWIGIQRNRPVEFLFVLCSLMLIAIMVALIKRPKRTCAGDLVLARAKRTYDRKVRAPENSELGLAVAFLGTAALSGTAYAHYHDVRQPSSSDGGSSSSDSDSSGGGGGGCGGCGGGD